MFRYSKRGFTLIELLIVMVIMSLSLSVVLPLSVAQVDSARQRSERHKLIVYLRQALLNSYYFNSQVKISVQGKKLFYELGDQQKDELELNYLSFEEQAINLVYPGPANVETLTAWLNGNKWLLEISSEEISWSDTN